MEISEKNKLIAEFMGGEISIDEFGRSGYFLPHSREIGIEGNSSKSNFYDERWLDIECKYHASWDWLMPVLIKCYQTSKSDDWDMWLNDSLLTVNIYELFNKIVEFIQWYNKQK